jgi:hypothetical protein
VITAAQLVLHKDKKQLGTESVQKIRALLPCLLYPSITLNEQSSEIEFPESDGYDKKTIEESTALIGAFMGQKRLNEDWDKEFA